MHVTTVIAVLIMASLVGIIIAKVVDYFMDLSNEIKRIRQILESLNEVEK